MPRMHRKTTDVVAIRFARQSGRLRINGVAVIGSAAPCGDDLQIGDPLIPALRCLIRNGFRLIFRRNGLVVLIRVRRVP